MSVLVVLTRPVIRRFFWIEKKKKNRREVKQWVWLCCARVVSAVAVVMGGGQSCFHRTKTFAEDSLLPTTPPFSWLFAVNN